MPGSDPERIAQALRDMDEQHVAAGRIMSAQMLLSAAEEMDRMREYLLETSGRLHQIASDHAGLNGTDTRALANDMARMANRRD